MTERDFVYWLKGFLEMSDTKTMSETQVSILRDHIDLVFNKVTPERGVAKVSDKLVHAATYAGHAGVTVCGAPLNEETKQSGGAVTCELCKALMPKPLPMTGGGTVGVTSLGTSLYCSDIARSQTFMTC